MKPDLFLVDLVVRDMDASIAFYRALGVEIPDTAVWRTPTGTHHVDIVLPGGVTLHLDSPALAGVYDRGWREPSGTGTRVVIGFRVEARDEVDRLHAKLTALGHRERATHPGTRSGARATPSSRIRTARTSAS